MVMTPFLSPGTQKGDLPAIPGYQPAANGKPLRLPPLLVWESLPAAATKDFRYGSGASVSSRIHRFSLGDSK